KILFTLKITVMDINCHTKRHKQIAEQTLQGKHDPEEYIEMLDGLLTDPNIPDVIQEDARVRIEALTQFQKGEEVTEDQFRIALLEATVQALTERLAALERSGINRDPEKPF
ncbi:MAG: hypothetical protein AAF223_03535, partial [Bacteroidota bacterium]